MGCQSHIISSMGMIILQELMMTESAAMNSSVQSFVSLLSISKECCSNREEPPITRTSIDSSPARPKAINLNESLTPYSNLLSREQIALSTFILHPIREQTSHTCVPILTKRNVWNLHGLLEPKSFCTRKVPRGHFGERQPMMGRRQSCWRLEPPTGLRWMRCTLELKEFSM